MKDPRPGFAATQQGYTPVLTPLEIVSDDGGGSIIPPNHGPLTDSAGSALLDSAGNLLFGSD